MAAMGDRIRATRVKVITRMVYGDRSHSGRSSVNRTLPGPAGEVALVLARLILATIMFAHGYQKLFINGLGRTTQGFESMSIPAAIVSAAFVTVVELVGSVLVLAGALITIVAACYMIVMVGAAVFVHIPNGIFAADNGWELVGSIAALLLVLAAVGPGRWSVDHAVRTRQGSDLALDPVPPSSPTSAPPPQLTTSATDSRSSTPTTADVPAPTRSTDPLPFHRQRTEA
jgi:putative oxidoreductase